MFAASAFKIKVSIVLKLSVNEAKLTGLCARNCVTVQQVLLQNLPSGPKSYWAFRETGPWTGLFKGELR